MNKLHHFLTSNLPGIGLCLLIALPSWLLGKAYPIIGGPMIAILLGMIVNVFFPKNPTTITGIKFTSKYILQSAVVLLGFGMNLHLVLETGKQSLPIILTTILLSLFLAWRLSKSMNITSHIATLIGVGSSICGGSAIAATAPIIEAEDDEIATSIAVIFFYNVLAALLFPLLGKLLNFDITSGTAFGIFAGTAINDTSSVTSAASTWDGMWQLGTQTLDKAVTVKLTRTLAIIPITLGLTFIKSRQTQEKKDKNVNFRLKKTFPFFIILFLLASIITTIALSLGVPATTFGIAKTLSKFLIIMAMAAIGLNSHFLQLIKTGGKPIILGGICWIGITLMSLFMQNLLNLW